MGGRGHGEDSRGWGTIADELTTEAQRRREIRKKKYKEEWRRRGERKEKEE
jgi:hypothetical protein